MGYFIPSLWVHVCVCVFYNLVHELQSVKLEL